MEGNVSLCQYLIWLVIVLGQLHGYKCCIEKEREAMFELKTYIISRTVKGYFNSELTTWTNDSKSDCCRWKGVDCNHTSGRVIEIAFGGLFIKEGSLLNLSSLHPFEEVRSLQLPGIGNFGFSGFFYDVEGYKSLERLRNLEILDLSENNFNNSIFPFLNAATSLTKLFLGINNMDGPFPVKELNALTNLELLDLNTNRFNGSMPIQDHHILKRLRNLEHLDLSYNKFDNSIFPTLNAATSLTTLFLRGNNMNSPVPFKELGDLRNLELLDLSENRFNGSIPAQELFSMGKLKALDLSDNDFFGSMELQLQGICKLKNLQELDLRKNKLVGQFPLCLTSLTGLRVLDLSSNHLTGKLPSALANLDSLEYLSLFDNDFEGLFSLDWLTNLSKLKVFKLDSKSNSLQVVSNSSWEPKFQLRVIALQSCNLEKVPHFLLHQKNLRQVDLSDNNISESFPSWVLENNTKLEVLHLQNNSLTSFHLPGFAHNLSFLDVSDNEFSQLFPENIGWILPRLRYMNISKNGFDGNLPSSLGNMKRLGFLDISHNRFQGKLPTSLVKGCYSLLTLKLSHNKLRGEVFQESANFTGIVVLSMDNNQFTGKIGQGLRSLTSLYMLDISNNNLSGVIPSWFDELPSLSALLLSNNSLEGEIPISLFNRSGPQLLLDLSANNLSGDIPQHVNYTYPLALFLQDNKLSGVVPDTLLANVRVLDLRNNRLSGNIPGFINTQNISVLLLRGNNLTGRIPHQLCRLRNIQLLDLSNNRLNGSIPSCISNAFGLGKEDTTYGVIRISAGLSNVGIDVKSLLLLDSFVMGDTTTKQISIEFATKHRYETYVGGILELLFGLDLSDNELSGEIPVELGNLLEIQSLNLSHNKLSGVIPESFSGLKNVESLDLSFNRLQGRIPQELTDLNRLSTFSIAFNNLSGVIPLGKQFNTFDTPSYLGNPLLCGEPTNTNCISNTGFQESDSGVKDDDESRIDMVSFYWCFGAAYVTILVGIFASLSFDSPWSRFWFYMVDAFINKARHMLW